MTEINLEDNILKLTLGDIVQSFSEEDLQKQMPVFMQDIDADTKPIIETYQQYLSSGDFTGAETYRDSHPELDTRIWDAFKANSFMAYAAYIYLYAKNQKQQCEVGSIEPTGQVEGDIWFKEETTSTGKKIYIPYILTIDGYTEFSIGANIIDNFNSEDPDSSLSARCGKVLYDKIMSFEETKSDIVGSALGQALSLTDKTETEEGSTWEEVVYALGNVLNNGELNWSPKTSETYEIPSGYYSGGILDCSAVYEQGKKDALKAPAGIAIYPATNGVTWSGNTSASATGANESTQSASRSCMTTDRIDLTNASYISAVINGNCNPTSAGSGSKNAMGSGSASIAVSSDGSTALATKVVNFGVGSSSKTVVLDVSALSGLHFVHVNTSATGGYITNTKPRYWYGTSTVSLSSVKVGSK